MASWSNRRGRGYSQSRRSKMKYRLTRTTALSTIVNGYPSADEEIFLKSSPSRR